MATPAHIETPEERTRRLFQERANARLAAMKVPPRGRVSWVAQRCGVRWQTAQKWLTGQTVPLGRNLARLSGALGVDFKDLLGDGADLEPDGVGWIEFQATPEGRSMTEDERTACLVFPWAKAPTLEDFRGLLMVLRNNATRR